MTLFELVSSRRHEVSQHLGRAIWPLSNYVDEGMTRAPVRREAVADLLARDRGWSGHPSKVD